MSTLSDALRGMAENALDNAHAFVLEQAAEALDHEPATGGFVVDRRKVAEAIRADLMRHGFAGANLYDDVADAAIAEYERQRAEHAKGGAT